MSKQNDVITGPKYAPSNFQVYDINNDDTVFTAYNFINGDFVAPRSGEYFCNVNPAKSKVVSYLPCSSKPDIDYAVSCASVAFPEWSVLSMKSRAKYLFAIADQVEQRLDEFAILESRDVGKPYHLGSKGDIAQAISNWRFFASQVEHATSPCLVRNNSEDSAALDYIYRKPLGVVASITPWNFPFLIISEQIAPAIVYGNCIVLKPCELTPMTAFLLCDVLRKVKLPPGVVNVVHGFGAQAGVALCENPKVRGLAFVGGTVTGRKIHLACAPTFKKVKLEMGGKNASIVFDDVDIDQTVKMCSFAGFANQGEICVCGSRIYVHEAIYPQFVEKFVALTKKMWLPTVGDPLNPKTMSGPLVSLNHREKVEGYIRLAKEEGGKILVGGFRPRNLIAPFTNGSFHEPTVIVDLPVTARCATEEIFGPVVTIHPFSNEKEVIQRANMLEYGLAGSLFTKDISRAHRVAQAVETGRLWVNHWGEFENRMPFGGVKQSGIGRQGGEYSRDFWTMCKHISCKL